MSLSIGKCHPLRPPKTRTIILVSSSSFFRDATTAISPCCLFGRRRRFRTEKRPLPSPSLRTHGSHTSFLTPPFPPYVPGGGVKKEESGHIFADASSSPFFGGLFLRSKPRDIHFQWLSHQRKVEFDKVPSSIAQVLATFPSYRLANFLPRGRKAVSPIKPQRAERSSFSSPLPVSNSKLAFFGPLTTDFFYGSCPAYIYIVLKTHPGNVGNVEL